MGNGQQGDRRFFKDYDLTRVGEEVICKEGVMISYNALICFKELEFRLFKYLFEECPYF